MHTLDRPPHLRGPALATSRPSSNAFVDDSDAVAWVGGAPHAGMWRSLVVDAAPHEELAARLRWAAQIGNECAHTAVRRVIAGLADPSEGHLVEPLAAIALDHLIDRAAALPLPIALRIGIDLLDGLAALHAHRGPAELNDIVVRNVSVESVAVTWEGRVLIHDLFWAQSRAHLAEAALAEEIPHLGVRSIAWTPEMGRGVTPLTSASDVFAAGQIIYELITGVPPFDGATPILRVRSIVLDKPLNPRELVPDLPMEVVRVLSKLLEKDPEHRFGAGEAAGAFRDVLRAEGIAAGARQIAAFIAAQSPPPPPTLDEPPSELLVYLLKTGLTGRKARLGYWAG